MTPDRRITDVAREWTAAEPASDLRARVMARLDARPAIRARRAWIFVPIAAATAAAIGFGIVGSRADHGMRGARGIAPAAVAAVHDAAAARAARDRAGHATIDATPRVARITGAPHVIITAAGNDLPALAEPAPITLLPIQPEELVLPQLNVQPLVLPAPLVVDPLGDGGANR